MTKNSSYKTPRTSRAKAQKNRQARYDALREELKAKEYIRQIQNDYDELQKLIPKIERAKSEKLVAKAKGKSGLKGYGEANLTIQKCLAQKEVLKLKIETNFKRLKFVLPELKSVEITDPEGGNPFAQFIELMTQAAKDNSK